MLDSRLGSQSDGFGFRGLCDWPKRLNILQDIENVTYALLSEGSEVYGRVECSVIGPGTVVSEGAVVRNSVIQEDCFVARGAVVENAVIARGSTIGSGAVIGAGDGGGICVIGEDTIVPDGAIVERQTGKVGGKEGDRP